MSFLDIVAPERREETAKTISQLSKKLRLIYETVFQSGDGAQIPVEVMSHAFEYGNKKMLLSIARDISRRREMELKVAEACERERADLAREIHDVLCQELTGGNMIMSGLKAIIEHDLPESIPVVEKLESAMARMMATARKISTGLYPAELKKDGFSNAVSNFLLGQETLHKIKIIFRRSPGFVDPKKAAGLNLYRIVQETVCNSIKHSKSARLSVLLKRDKDSNIVVVEDDGVGFEVKKIKEGMGMSIIRHRALIAGASLKIESSPGKGCRMTCIWK
jgi:NarL family two-component system sensor histidine kinase LiaS